MLEINENRDEAMMPLVLCHSLGGPYDDEAFLSGWRLAGIAATLAGPGITAVVDSIRPRERLQADLIAMGRGYAMTAEPDGEPDWLSVTFTRLRDVD